MCPAFMAQLTEREPSAPGIKGTTLKSFSCVESQRTLSLAVLSRKGSTPVFLLRPRQGEGALVCGRLRGGAGSSVGEALVYFKRNHFISTC